MVVPRPSSGQDPLNALLIDSSIPATLPTHHIVVRIDRFAFSSNNITYQALGEIAHFRYFDFHGSPKDPGVNGVIPVWAYGSVIASNVPAIKADERVFGYFAMARYLLLPVETPSTNKFNFYVPRPHLPADRRPYNQITRCGSDPLYRPSDEDLSMIYRPLFWTSFWAEDWLYTAPESPYNGASAILISSASAKTAFCLAYRIRKRGKSDVTVIGFTSRGNLAFTRKLGLYDWVFTYENVEACVLFGSTGIKNSIYVDIAGNETFNSKITQVLGPSLVRNISLGVTNLNPTIEPKYYMPSSGVTQGAGSDNTSESVEFFFMPEWLAVRKRTLTPPDIAFMQYTAWTDLMRDCLAWVTIERTWGAETVKEAYLRAVVGRINPEKGMIWSMWDENEVLANAGGKAGRPKL